MPHFGLRAVQQSLAARSIQCRAVDPYPDGRNRYAVWPQGKRFLAKHSDDVDEVYILGLRMAVN
jgi:hypothetical protein